MGVNPVLNIISAGNCTTRFNDAVFAYRINYIELSNTSDLNALNFDMNDFTAEFRFKFLGASSDRIIMSNRTTNNNGYVVGLKNGQPYVKIGSVDINFTPIDISFGTLNLCDNLCHLLTIKRQYDTIYFYVDGVLAGTGNLMPLASFSGGNTWLLNDRISLQNLLTTGQVSLGNFTGWLGEVRFWNRALTNSEIAQFHNKEITNYPSNLIAHYLFEENVGDQRLLDRVGSTHGRLGNSQQADSHDPTRVRANEVECAQNYPFLPPFGDDYIQPTQADITVFANPFQESFTVYIPEQYTQEVKATLMTIQGSAIEKRTLPKGKNLWKPANPLPAGMYLLQLVGNDKTTILRIIKQ